MIECFIYSSVQKIGVSKRFIEDCIQQVCTRLGKKEVQCSIHLIGDTRMTTLNRIHRGKNKTTDVLSFPSIDAHASSKFIAPTSQEGGDIFISIAQIRRQAKDHHISFQEEFARMLVHGTLHIFGYDHEKKSEAAEMFSLQESLVNTVCTTLRS